MQGARGLCGLEIVCQLCCLNSLWDSRLTKKNRGEARRTHAVVVRGEHVAVRADARVATLGVSARPNAAETFIQLALVDICNK